MISIKKFLLAGGRAEQAMEQVCRLLLEGMEQSVADDRSEPNQKLRQSIRNCVAAMDSRLPHEELIEHAGTTVEALKEYRQHIFEDTQQPLDELRAKVKILTSAITAVSSSSHANIRHLQQIKNNVLSMDVKETRSLRAKLGECLDSILAEAERQRSETDFAVAQLHRVNAPPHAPPSPGGAPRVEMDPATGLPNRAQAEASIARACQDGTPAYVVLLVLNRMDTLTRSFGEEMGEMVLSRFSGFVRQHLHEADQVFRWTGPALAALVRRSAGGDAVRNEIGTLLEHKLEHTVDAASRKIQLPISARWTVLPLMSSPLLLFRKMDTFAGFE